MTTQKISDLLALSNCNSLFVDHQDSYQLKPVDYTDTAFFQHLYYNFFNFKIDGNSKIYYKDQDHLIRAGVFYSIDLKKLVYLENDDLNLWGNLMAIKNNAHLKDFMPEYYFENGFYAVVNEYNIDTIFEGHKPFKYLDLQTNYNSGHHISIYELQGRIETHPYYDNPDQKYYDERDTLKATALIDGQLKRVSITRQFYRNLDLGRINSHPILGDFVPLIDNPRSTLYLSIDAVKEAGKNVVWSEYESRYIIENEDTYKYLYLKDGELKEFYALSDFYGRYAGEITSERGREIVLTPLKGESFFVQYQNINFRDVNLAYEDDLWQPVGRTYAPLNIETLRHLVSNNVDIYFCTHCKAWRVDSENRGGHNAEQCRYRNFSNDRFDYHSRKPKARNVGGARFVVGVEIEKECYEGGAHSCHDIRHQFGWIKERDGSLDSVRGYELVSPKFSLMNDSLIKEAEKVEAKFNGLINGKYSSSCGGHIHFSERGKSGRTLLENVCGYLPLFYAIYSKRIGKTYCEAKEKGALLRSGEKYQAVRVMNDRIEWRIFPAVKNIETLKWRLDFLKIIAKHQTSDPVKVVNMLLDKRTELHKHFLKIFNKGMIYERAKNALQYAKNFDADCYNIDLRKEYQIIDKQAQKDLAKTPRSKTLKF